jgi:hypothetical protein
MDLFLKIIKSMDRVHFLLGYPASRLAKSSSLSSVAPHKEGEMMLTPVFSLDGRSGCVRVEAAVVLGFAQVVPLTGQRSFS